MILSLLFTLVIDRMRMFVPACKGTAWQEFFDSEATHSLSYLSEIFSDGGAPQSHLDTFPCSF